MIDLFKAMAWSFLFVLRLMPLGGCYHAYWSLAQCCELGPSGEETWAP